MLKNLYLTEADFYWLRHIPKSEDCINMTTSSISSTILQTINGSRTFLVDVNKIKIELPVSYTMSLLYDTYDDDMYCMILMMIHYL